MACPALEDTPGSGTGSAGSWTQLMKTEDTSAGKIIYESNTPRTPIAPRASSWTPGQKSTGSGTSRSRPTSQTRKVVKPPTPKSEEFSVA